MKIGDMTVTSVLVADALPLVSEALATCLGLEPDLLILEDRPGTGPAAVEVATRLKPDVTIVDYWMPDMDGAAIADAILAQVPSSKIIVLSWLHGPAQIEKALAAGAVGFLPKDCSLAQLTEAVRLARDGHGPLYAEELQDLITARMRRAGRDRRRLRSLSPREIEILSFLNRGRSTSQIAAELGISPKTVTNHISQILEKTDSRSQAEALAKARSRGFF